MPRFNRRRFLQGSAMLGGSLLASAVGRTVRAAPALIETPVVDRVVIREITDNQHNIFLAPLERPGLKVQRTGFPGAPQGKTLESEWGLALHIESAKGSESRRYLLDFGFTSDVYTNNLDLLKLDPAAVDAMIVSHGHFDHYGGLMGFLDKYRNTLPVDVKLYAGGEDNFCHRLIGAPGQLTDFGALDRRALAARGVATVLCEHPTVIAGHAFTTGQIKRSGIEKVLPNTMVEYGIKDGLGCDATQYTHFTAAELQGKIVPDEHTHEHATCFNVKDRGLVVITSCGHVGILNTIRQAQEVSGVKKLHALVGGFHLGPATPDYTDQVVAELKTFEPDVVVPMHCSGQTFVDSVQKIMPDKLLLSSAAARLDFGA